MDIRETLHEALDIEDFPSRTLIDRSMSRLDSRHTPPFARVASLIAATIAIALIATLVAVRLEAPQTHQGLPGAAEVSNVVGYQAVSAQVGWVHLRTDVDVVAKTSDGGRRWQEVLRVAGLKYGAKMQFVDQNNGVLIGQTAGSAAVWITTDGGAHWKKSAVIQMEVSQTVETGYFIGAREGWVLVRNDVMCAGCGETVERFVYHTVDEGAHWTQVSTVVTGGWVVDLTFVTPTWGVLRNIAALGGYVVTQDGGRSWLQP